MLNNINSCGILKPKGLSGKQFSGANSGDILEKYQPDTQILHERSRPHEEQCKKNTLWDVRKICQNNKKTIPRYEDFIFKYNLLETQTKYKKDE